jgi:hypothetical protein
MSLSVDDLKHIRKVLICDAAECDVWINRGSVRADTVSDGIPFTQRMKERKAKTERVLANVDREFRR